MRPLPQVTKEPLIAIPALALLPTHGLVRLLSFQRAAKSFHNDRGEAKRGCGNTMKNLALSKVYQLLEPGPVVLLTTARRGRANIMTLSWHMMVEFEPPLVACVVSNRNHSFAALRATKECVIAIPALKLAPKVVEVGNCSGRNVDKFERFGLTPVPAELVAPPLVAECFANLECKVADTRFVNKYCMFVLEVLKAWIDRAQRDPKTIHHHGYGRFAVDGEMIRLNSRMR
jgi:flavin reductase (DIM6/NTAB) family NADH-FMN oxidoreductase RutF